MSGTIYIPSRKNFNRILKHQLQCQTGKNSLHIQLLYEKELCTCILKLKYSTFYEARSLIQEPRDANREFGHYCP